MKLNDNQWNGSLMGLKSSEVIAAMGIIGKCDPKVFSALDEAAERIMKKKSLIQKSSDFIKRWTIK